MFVPLPVALAAILIVLNTPAAPAWEPESSASPVRTTPVEAPLADAAEARRWSDVRTLLDRDRDVDAQQADGMSALHWAVHHGDERTVRALIDTRADVNLATAYGVTPLSIACSRGDAAIVGRLLEAGADVDGTLSGGTTPLMLAARAGNTESVRHFVEYGAKVNATERRKQTALMWAAAAGHVEVVDALLEAGADVDAATNVGFTAMMFAARNGRIDVVKRLLDAGVDVNAVVRPKGGGQRVPRSGTSALLFAVESGHYELAMFLVESGADPNDQRSGYAPLHALSWVRKPDRGENADGDPPPRGSGRLTDLAFVHEIVAAGADVNLTLKNGKGGRAVLNPKGATPLLLASKTADLPLIKLYVELGADPHRPNVEGCTPLMAAAGVGVRAVGEEAGTEEEVIETIDYLVGLGADMNAVDENRETAMHGAAYRNFPEVVATLHRHGADPAKWNHRNKPGWTPVMIAQGKRPGSFKPSPETVRALEAAMQPLER